MRAVVPSANARSGTAASAVVRVSAAPADGDQLGFAVAAGPGALLVAAPGDPAGASPGGAVLQLTR